MSDDFVSQVSQRYIELFETITGNPFKKETVPSNAEIVAVINGMS